jgi:hypothetical protein
MHERALLRKAIAADLVGQTAAANRVFQTRLEPMQETELPALTVYVEEESVDPASEDTAPRELTRLAQVAIVGWVRASPATAVEDALDDLALEIETVMDRQMEHGGTVAKSILSSTEIAMKMDGSRPMGAIRLVYSVTYRTDLRVVAPTDIFDTADVRFSLGGAQAADDQANDLITNINQE